MNWNQAQAIIKDKIRIGVDLNTKNSKYRFVDSIETEINSQRYGYSNESGYVILIGKSNKVSIPWSMLKICYFQLQSAEGYDGKFFRKHFIKQAQDHPCHVRVVGQIFVVAGIGFVGEDNKYWLRKS